jgi:ubiquinone/menaquinone biosynthesis C-methylase UbiE
MKRPEFIARQSGNPSGPLGRIIAWIMARETAAVNERAVELLSLQARDRVLEVGFGHGRTIGRIASVVSEGRIAGIDVSESMTKLAGRKNRAAVAMGRVDLHTGDASALPFEEGAFDKLLSVHTIYFWKDPAACLRELRRVLQAGGTLVLGFTPKESPRTASFPADVYTFYGEDEICTMLTAARFTSIETIAGGPAMFARAMAG